MVVAVVVVVVVVVGASFDTNTARKPSKGERSRRACTLSAMREPLQCGCLIAIKSISTVAFY